MCGQAVFVASPECGCRPTRVEPEGLEVSFLTRKGTCGNRKVEGIDRPVPFYKTNNPGGAGRPLLPTPLGVLLEEVTHE